MSWSGPRAAIPASEPAARTGAQRRRASDVRRRAVRLHVPSRRNAGQHLGHRHLHGRQLGLYRRGTCRRDPAGGGRRRHVESRDGQASYTGSTRNGITSSSYPQWDGSFVVLGTPLGGGAGQPPQATATGTVTVNGAPFTGGTVAYNSQVDVTKGALTLTTEAGEADRHRCGRARCRIQDRAIERRRTDRRRAPPHWRHFASCNRRLAATGNPKKIRQLLGHCQRAFPHARPLCLSERPRHPLADRRPVRRHVDAGARRARRRA